MERGVCKSHHAQFGEEETITHVIPSYLRPSWRQLPPARGPEWRRMAPCPTMVPALVALVKPQVEGRFEAGRTRIGPLNATAGPAKHGSHHPGDCPILGRSEND
jgi:hypothetical protein